MEAIWLKHYPPGIPAEVDVHQFASLRDMLLRSCQRFGELPAYSNMGSSMTYAELDRSSRDFAAYLQRTLGLRKGDRVAIFDYGTSPLSYLAASSFTPYLDRGAADLLGCLPVCNDGVANMSPRAVEITVLREPARVT